MAGSADKGTLSARLTNGLGLIWGSADPVVDKLFRYIGCFGLVRGPLLFFLSGVWPPARGMLCRATVPGSNIKVFLRLGSSDISVFNGIFRWLEYCWDLERSPRTVVDGGAYIGLSAIYFTMRYPGVRVIAVEASESNFNLLVRNTSDFPNIEPVHAALWPQPGSLELTDPEPACGASKSGMRARRTAFGRATTLTRSERSRSPIFSATTSWIRSTCSRWILRVARRSCSVRPRPG